MSVGPASAISRGFQSTETFPCARPMHAKNAAALRKSGASPAEHSRAVVLGAGGFEDIRPKT
jgi:hypothetical protein